MQDIQIDGVKNNTSILAFGSLFRRVNGSQWGVNLQLWPSQEKRSLRVSQLPVLVRRRVLNPTEPPKPVGYKRSVTIQDTSNWQICHIADCPVQHKRIAEQEARQLCFRFQSTGGLNVYLPQNELARALFLHDAYLSRAALEPGSLNVDFDIVHPDERNDPTIINVLGASGYPIKSLDYIANRRVLSWILLDPDARASFESISRYQMNDGFESKGYRHWYFQFDPPMLAGVGLSFSGYFDQQTNSLFAWEVTGVDGITHAVPDKVEFYNPGFTEYVRGTGQGGVRRPPVERPDQHNVQDGADANSDTNPVMLHAPAVGISFAKPFETTKVCKKRQNGTHGRKDDETDGVASKCVSTEDGDTTGGTPQADWNTPADQSDDTHLYVNKFTCFIRMLDQLVNEHHCQILSKEIRKLPKVGRSERHILKGEGLPRCMAVVAISCHGRSFHILEVDTSDGAKSLATKLLLICDKVQWNAQLEELERKLIKGALNWPRAYLDQICDQTGHESIPHPKTSCNHKGHLEPESIDKWAHRVKSWMISS